MRKHEDLDSEASQDNSSERQPTQDPTTTMSRNKTPLEQKYELTLFTAIKGFFLVILVKKVPPSFIRVQKFPVTFSKDKMSCSR